MTDRPIRPTRPSAVKQTPSVEASKFTDPQVRLSVRVHKSTLRNIKRTAVMGDRTVKRFVLDALAAQGVDIAEQDLLDSSES